MSPRWRQRAAAFGFGVAVLVLLMALRTLAASITAAHLLHQSERALATVQYGQPLWSWALRRPDDLVAGHAFGPADVAGDRSGLRITSRDGSPFDLGLPLAQPIDLGHWPLLRIRGNASQPGKLALIQQADGAPACLALQAAPLPHGDVALTIDLRRLRWESAGGGACRLPTVANMLRLRPRLPSHASLQLSDVALLPAAPAALTQAAGIRMPGGPVSMQQVVGRLAPIATPTPLIRLPPGSAERLLDWRDAIRQRWPAALLVVGEQRLAAPSGGPWSPTLAWAAGALYLLALLSLGWRAPRSKSGRWLELGAIVAGPLWLIAGLQWGSPTGAPATIAFAAALVYAARVEWLHRDRAWRWVGHWRDAWPALLAVPVAFALVQVVGHPLHRIAPHAVVAYLLWACLQQWLLLAVLLRRLETLVPIRVVVVVLTGTLFALLHTPNGALMQLCLLGECGWAWYFMRHRALLPIAVAHTSCALLVQAGLVGPWLRSLEVSARFFS
jgi:hypothetical protein